MLEFLLILNTLWFFGGFHLFALRGRVFAKVVVPKEHRDTPIMETLIVSGKFVGGFNFAFVVLNLLLLFNQTAFDQNIEKAIVLFSIAVAHGSQFAYNVPIFLENQSGGGVWQVKGLMRFIFATDFSLMLANGIFAAWYIL